MLQAETQKAKMAAIEAGPIKVKVVRVERPMDPPIWNLSKR